MGLTLARALRVEDFPGSRTWGSLNTRRTGESLVVAFAGAGGKTTAMFQLAHQLRPPVIVTTTTHLGAWQAALADEHIVVLQSEYVAGPSSDAGHYIVTLTRRRTATETQPPPEQLVIPEASWPGTISLSNITLLSGPAGKDDRLGEPNLPGTWLHDIVLGWKLAMLVEADGARQKPLKAPAEHEPNIPAYADLVVVVAGLSALGKPLSDEYVHRPKEFASISALRPGEPITADAVVRELMHPQDGGLKGMPEDARRVVLLNQADTPELQSQAHGMARQLLRSYEAVIVASLERNEIHAVHESVAGIVLAAGGSKRLGRPKQLLDWRGQPFVRVVAETALKAGLNPVVVVTGSDADPVKASLDSLPVLIAHNDAWQSGQASSIRTGVAALPASSGAAVFLLADQPQVRFDVIEALVDTHATGLHKIVAPLVMMEQRANPVLFDRDTFAALMALEGDVGGRAVFSKHRVEFMPWHDDRLLLDVDTEADYQRLVEDDTL